jgi:hypothetical protein
MPQGKNAATRGVLDEPWAIRSHCSMLTHLRGGRMMGERGSSKLKEA